ncbi:hypothetical protein MRX96_039708 [Rhipicephalus microplus]
MDAMPSNILYVVRETHNYFACSSVRQAAYRDVYHASNGGNEESEPLKILCPSGTRWLAIADFIDHIVPQYEALRLHFATVLDRNYNVRFFKDMYEDERNLAYLTFLTPILADLKREVRLFQGQDVDPLGVFEEVERLLKSLLTRIIKPSILRQHEGSLSYFDFMNFESVFF